MVLATHDVVFIMCACFGSSQILVQSPNFYMKEQYF